MNVSSWLRRQKSSSPELALDAELILLEAVGEREKSFLVAHGDRELTATELSSADADWRRRVEGEPLAYVLGRKEFYGRDFLVTPAVLIPRPESETMVELALELRPRSVVDVGTGSGCLATTMALELAREGVAGARVVGLDISEEALVVARENARRHGVEVEFRDSDLLTDYAGRAEVIMANLPYVDPGWDWLSPELEAEPALALYAEDGGLALIFRLLERAKGRCDYLLLEADSCQHERLKEYAAKLGWRHMETRGFILKFCTPQA